MMGIKIENKIVMSGDLYKIMRIRVKTTGQTGNGNSRRVTGRIRRFHARETDVTY
jgi:hypothetical protein